MFTIKPFITELLINITISPMIINFTTWTRLNWKLWSTFTRVLESSRDPRLNLHLHRVLNMTKARTKYDLYSRGIIHNIIQIILSVLTVSHVRPCFYCCWYFYNGPLLHFCEHKSDFCLHFPDYAAMIKHCCFTS